MEPSNGTEAVLQMRLRQQAAVAHLGQRALAGSELNELMAEAAVLVAQGLDVEFSKVMELSPGGETLLLRAGVGWDEGLVGNTTIGIGLESQAGYTLVASVPVVVDDLRIETRFTGPSLLRSHGVVSGISVIIEGRERPFGVLGAHTGQQRSFTLDDIHFVQSVANVLAGAVRYNQTIADREMLVQAKNSLREMELKARDRTVVLETANRVALDILASRSGTEALRHIADAARVLAGARYAALGVATADGLSLSEFITVGLTPQEEAAIGPRPRGAGVLGLLLSRTEPLRIDTLSHHSVSVGFPPNHPPMDSFLGVPIRRGETIVGSLYLTNKQGGGPFSEADEAAVQALGSHAAVAIHNLQMLSRQRALVSSLMTAQDEERRAVAYDLHDGLTQYVMAAHAHLGTFNDLYAGALDEPAANEIRQSLRSLTDAVVESRRLVNGLRLLALDDLGLAGAVEQLLNEEKERAGWSDAQLIHNLITVRFDKAVETGIYRIVQEGLTNARKHSDTQRVQVTLELEHMTGTEPEMGDRCLKVEVRDWGRGFDVNRRNDESGHVGLHGSMERVSLMNGQHKIVSIINQGTTLQATVPVIVI